MKKLITSSVCGIINTYLLPNYITIVGTYLQQFHFCILCKFKVVFSTRMKYRYRYQLYKERFPTRDV